MRSMTGGLFIKKDINNPSPPTAELPLHKGAFKIVTTISPSNNNLLLNFIFDRKAPIDDGGRGAIYRIFYGVFSYKLK